MKKQKKVLMLIPATLIFASQLTQASPDLDGFNGACTMYSVNASSSSSKPRTVQSDHTVSITNTDTFPKNYHVTYLNLAQQQGGMGVVAKKEFDVSLNSGEVKNDTLRIQGTHYFSEKGKWNLECRTQVTLNGKIVLYKTNYNYAYIE